MADLPLSDLLVLAAFTAIWIGYTFYADGPRRARHSLRLMMHGYRLQWMRRMLERENRVVDVNILRNLLQGVAFFASASLLILAGLLTILGSTDRTIEIVRALPFAAKTSLLQWELKLIVLCIIFVYAFFKFTWALRQFNYCATLIGAAPNGSDEDFVQRTAALSTHASKDFNQGLRAYYFSLAALGWFVSVWVFLLSTFIVVFILYQREYRSTVLRTLTSTVASEHGASTS